MKDCEVCRGSKIIRVPIYRWKLDAPILDIADSLAIDTSVRQYPCPECSAGDNMPYERLSVVIADRFAESRYENDPRFIEDCNMRVAHCLTAEMLKRGLIRIERGPVDGLRVQRPIRASAGVVSPVVVAKFEERVAQRQFEVAEVVVQEAINEIENWNSFYQGRRSGSVLKSQAIEWLFGALKKVRAKYG